MPLPRPSVKDLTAGILGGNRASLARAITLMESTRDDDSVAAQQLLSELLPHTGKALRVGISGVPGVGKSTFIESLGMMLLGMGHRVAVLAVDPSSAVSGGSILGDKTRMVELGRAPHAFIRPSPSGATLGGVARRTREAMLLCEAAGFDVVLVETVGVGQSETHVAQMVDSFLVLMLPGAGDELQGIKKGILELADVVAVNKADGNNVERAQVARRDYATALHFVAPRHAAWRPPVVTVSALTREGLRELWDVLRQHRETLQADASLDNLRADQAQRWMWSLVEERVLDAFHRHPAVMQQLERVTQAVRAQRLSPTQAAVELLAAAGLAGATR
jgi:LAO/AO transport system kinase